tara:strand:+ start:1717 stop:2295 length:579 start_codon:yes stop_codon:yes gene_type:complete
VKLILIIFYFLFLFQNFTKADDIKDFEIEGMSIGDSLLNFFSKNEIENLRRNYVQGKDYYVVGIDDKLSTYQTTDVYIKTGDTNYTIRTLGGMIFYDNLDNCLKKKSEISKDISFLFPNIKVEKMKGQHHFDPSGESKMYQSIFLLNELEDHVRIDCVTWSEKMKKEKKFTNYLAVIAMTHEINEWIRGGYN